MDKKITIELTVEELYALIDLTFEKRKQILDDMDARNRIATTEEWNEHAYFKELSNKLRNQY